MDAAVGPERQAFLQRCCGLGRAHRHRDHLTVGASPLQFHCLGDGGRVEWIQQQRNTFAPEGLRLLVELDRVGPGDLFDEANDLHLWEPNHPCWPSCTTSMAISSRWR